MRLRHVFTAWCIAGATTAGACLGAEYYLRAKKETYIVRQQEVSRKGGALFVEHDPEFLIQYTPQGRRLVPGTRVIIKNHNLSHQDVPITVNALGFRDDEVALQKKAGEIRILALGDSITLGDYLPAEKVFVQRAEDHVRQSFPKLDVSIINAGVGDIGIAEEVAILKEQGLRAQPDIVLLCFYLNDTRPPWGFPAELGRPGWVRQHSVLADAIYRNIKLRGWVREKGEDRFSWISQYKKSAWQTDRKAFLQLAALARYDWGAGWETDFETVAAPYLDEIRSLAAANNFKVLVAAFPVWFQIYADFVEDAPQQQLKNASAGRGFAFLDLLPVLREHRDTKLLFDHCHPNEYGNELIAGEIARSLSPLLMLPTAAATPR